jgi:hypothetical protein
VTDELEPVAADVSKEPRTSRPTRLGRAFGALLAWLAIWQILSPDEGIPAICSWIALAASVPWFVACPRYLRYIVTAALLAVYVVLIRLR